MHPVAYLHTHYQLPKVGKVQPPPSRSPAPHRTLMTYRSLRAMRSSIWRYSEYGRTDSASTMSMTLLRQDSELSLSFTRSYESLMMAAGSKRAGQGARGGVGHYHGDADAATASPCIYAHRQRVSASCFAGMPQHVIMTTSSTACRGSPRHPLEMPNTAPFPPPPDAAHQ